ncbi:MAG TPA: fasciclin domain-containing protein [Pedobacter sp.]|uniref:fasciclin domain-containing protein n=1 Tax=Pedobacter sp. TaxID=1411316 RepID=UPI002B9809EF|nr:fasciclin domain-containing protein [Pedobacter sp.]HMI02808.1 fasciclin domain-containing protein [Pedobacter sp.]
MKTYLTFTNTGVWLGLALLLVFASCRKDEYYFDGGVQNPVFDGNMLQYLQSKPGSFDTISSIIKIAGLEREFQDDNLTFFAPTDEAVRLALKDANQLLYQRGRDTLKVLEDISPEIWRKYLMRYMFKGANKVNDYYQLDLTLQAVYPGQSYYSYNKTILNIGVIYDDINGIKYAGYRHLAISYIPDLNRPLENWLRTDVSSSDIQPTNGVVHTLRLDHRFGFDFGFVNEIYSSR